MSIKLNIDKSIAVALRRIIMQNIPNYCFNNIIIDINDTLLDNDHLRKRIQNIPVEKIFINLKKLKSIDPNFIINNDYDSNLIIDEMKIECHKKYNPDKNDIIQSITTDDCNFYLNNKKINNPYSYKIKIVDLKYHQDEIKFS